MDESVLKRRIWLAVSYYTLKLLSFLAIIAIGGSWMIAWIFQSAELSGLLFPIGIWLCFGVVEEILRALVYHPIVGEPGCAEWDESLEFYSSSFGMHNLGAIVRSLCQQRNLPMPLIGVVLPNIPGAANWAFLREFVFRKDEMIIEVSLLRALKEGQLRAVVAHELRHSNAGLHYFRNFCHCIKSVMFLPWVATTWMLAFRALFAGEWLHLLVLVVFSGTLLVVCRELLEISAARISTANEHITDILSCWDTRSPQDLVDSLGVIRQSSEFITESLASRVGRRLEKTRKIDFGAIPLWDKIKMAPGILFALFALAVATPFLILQGQIKKRLRPLYQTHPADEQRREALAWIFGELNEPEQLNLPRVNTPEFNLPGVVVVEVADLGLRASH